jgi:holliday junction DNA helicase RuvB
MAFMGAKSGGARMVREEVVGPSGNDDDQRWQDDLRPGLLDDCVGQREVIQRLKIAIRAAKKRGEALEHILFDGPPGLGKTTFALALPREMGVPVQITSGPALTAPKDLMPYLTNLQTGSVLFIDEIHRLPKAVEEFIYSAMEDYRVDIVLGDGLNARTISMPLNRFTMIGATTRTGLIAAPLRDRFMLHEHMDFYPTDDLAEIVRRSAAKLGCEIDQAASTELARRARGTPRVANSYLRWCRNYADSEHDGRITATNAHSALDMLGVDDVGLDKQDRRYLEVLIRVYKGGPAGVEAIAATMNITSDTLSDYVEPYLLRIGFVTRTSRGRCATEEAIKHMGLAGSAAGPEDSQQRLF